MTTYEVEVKVAASLDRVRSRLDALGAACRGAVRQDDTYYDAPHREFAETDEAVRLRRCRTDAGETVRLTYKGPLVDAKSKTREEVETDVADGDAVDAILRNLGFEPAATVCKDRERYELDGYTVTLDAVEDVGEFVEVEIDADEEEIASARDGAYAVLERLDLDPDAQLQTSYLAMVLESTSER